MLFKRCLWPLVLFVAFSASASFQGNDVKQDVKKGVKNLNIQLPNCGYVPGLKPLAGDDPEIWVSKSTMLGNASQKCKEVANPIDASTEELRLNYGMTARYYEAASNYCWQSNRNAQDTTYAFLVYSCNRGVQMSPGVCDQARKDLAVAQAYCNSAYKNLGMTHCKVTRSGVAKCSNTQNLP